MTLTLNHGPLSADPPRQTNYTIAGPDHRLLFHRFPRRVRAVFAGETLLDTRHGMLLQETGCLPQLYVPSDDARQDLLESSDHGTCATRTTASTCARSVGGYGYSSATWSSRMPIRRGCCRRPACPTVTTSHVRTRATIFSNRVRRGPSAPTRAPLDIGHCAWAAG
ncbi:DUF427 domain-containing protein [Jiangella aurantiaca]|uniref:DUF427 domain-containing protein n=1 Tax=Jiangella aurantiaca TaxID=2530373 RepID=A0A4R5ABS3_9ACTN|nr:DUF427 domain-containing protein [Jiangella aurantiaca]